MKKKSSKPKAIFFLLLFAGFASGVAYLGTKDIPAPTHPVEKQLDASRFLK